MTQSHSLLRMRQYVLTLQISIKQYKTTTSTVAVIVDLFPLHRIFTVNLTDWGHFEHQNTFDHIPD